MNIVLETQTFFQICKQFFENTNILQKIQILFENLNISSNWRTILNGFFNLQIFEKMNRKGKKRKGNLEKEKKKKQKK